MSEESACASFRGMRSGSEGEVFAQGHRAQGFSTLPLSQENGRAFRRPDDGQIRCKVPNTTSSRNIRPAVALCFRLQQRIVLKALQTGALLIAEDSS